MSKYPEPEERQFKCRRCGHEETKRYDPMTMMTFQRCSSCHQDESMLVSSEIKGIDDGYREHRE